MMCSCGTGTPKAPCSTPQYRKFVKVGRLEKSAPNAPQMFPSEEKYDLCDGFDERMCRKANFDTRCKRSFITVLQTRSTLQLFSKLTPHQDCAYNGDTVRPVGTV
jgi:hypothetical protein